jgi:hypothetical protein
MSERPSEGFEDSLQAMVNVRAIRQIDVERQLRRAGESLKELARKLNIEFTHFCGRQIRVEHHKRS